MSTFLRLELAGRPVSTILLNVDAIVRVHPTWPQGCTIVTTDNTSLNVRPSLDEIQKQMTASNGRIVVKWIGRLVDEVDQDYEAMRADLVP